MKLQGFAMSYTKWDAIKHLFAPKAKVKDVIDSYDLVKAMRIANNREAFRNVR